MLEQRVKHVLAKLGRVRRGDLSVPMHAIRVESLEHLLYVFRLMKSNPPVMFVHNFDAQ